MAVVHQEVGKRESRRSHAGDEYAPARRWRGIWRAQIERIPARQQAVDLESPRQFQHVFQCARLGLRNIDRFLFLVNAGFHAVVADAVPGRRHQRIVDDDDRQRADRQPFGLDLVELGNFFLERAARQRDAERALLERGRAAAAGALFLQPFRARILALLVAPDAVVRLVERADEIDTRIGELETCAAANMRGLSGERATAAGGIRDHRHEPLIVELVRRLEQHARPMQHFARGRQRGPCRVAQCQLEFSHVRRLIRLPASDVLRERKLAEFSAEDAGQLRAQRQPVDPGGLLQLDLMQRLPLHEQSLATEQRREFVVPRGQRVHLGLNIEQFGNEIVEVRRQRNQQFGFLLDGERSGMRARVDESLTKQSVRRRECACECGVEPHEPVTTV